VLASSNAFVVLRVAVVKRSRDEGIGNVQRLIVMLSKVSLYTMPYGESPNGIRHGSLEA